MDTVGDALRTDCAEDWFSEGIIVSTGNCMGGGSAYNGGVYIEEQKQWLNEQIGSNFFDEIQISEAFEWVSVWPTGS